MTETGLKIISDDMASLELNYGLLEWDGGPVYPYYVGEYQEVPSMNEDGMEETSFILTGFTRGQLLELEKDKKKIKKLYPQVGGKVVIADDGSAVAIFYSDSFMVTTGDAELKKIQINLTIKEWSVN